ncbi:MAG: hypothetical protein NUK65_10005 [Firmicutes bacterium]|nr:hypothetical protein [Bacillota bacterium]
MFPNDVQLLPQEESTKATFTGQLVMARGFIEKFSPNESQVAIQALVKIIGQRVESEEGADYFQAAVFNGEKFWVIDDGSMVTYLLPEEY